MILRHWGCGVRSTNGYGKRQAIASALDTAITAYQRGFYIRNDYYNGINFAFLLNVRAAASMWRRCDNGPGNGKSH